MPPALSALQAGRVARPDTPMEQWELLIIDNAAGALTAGTWGPVVATRCTHASCDENELTIGEGAHARHVKRQLKLLVFVDDDERARRQLPHLSAQDWQCEFGNSGVWGGRNFIPEFEVEPAERSVTVSERHSPHERSKRHNGATSQLAEVLILEGLCTGKCRDRVRLLNNKSQIRIGGRIVEQFLSGEDNEICSVGAQHRIGAVDRFPAQTCSTLCRKNE